MSLLAGVLDKGMISYAFLRILKTFLGLTPSSDIQLLEHMEIGLIACQRS